MVLFRPATLFALILLFPILAHGDTRDAMVSAIDDRYEQNREIALNIWEFSELGFLEEQSTASVSAAIAIKQWLEKERDTHQWHEVKSFWHCIDHGVA